MNKFQNQYNSNHSSIKSPHNFKQNFDSNVFSTNPFSPTNQQSLQNANNSNSNYKWFNSLLANTTQDNLVQNQFQSNLKN